MEWLNLLGQDFKEIIIVITPWFLTIGWIFMFILFANRISGSIDKFDEVIQVISPRYKLFYGINAIALLLIFVIPLMTPIIAILAFSSFGFRISTFRVDWEERDDETPKFASFISVLFAIIPGIITIAIFPDFFIFTQFLWITYWMPIIEPLYRISLCISSALTIGTLCYIFITGVAEYENASVLEGEKVNISWIKPFEAILIILFLFLEFSENPLIQIFYFTGLFICIFVAFVNFVKGRKQPDFENYLLGYILMIIFYGANLIRWSMEEGEGTQLIVLITVIFSALMYIVLYFISFFTYEEK
ncbi:MAG: hypothetical protein GY870_02485 [archaeon]|nr:hypothetical protein [archaeon]